MAYVLETSFLPPRPSSSTHQHVQIQQNDSANDNNQHHRSATLVFDIGESCSRVGFAGEVPSCSKFPTIIGKRLSQHPGFVYQAALPSRRIGNFDSKSGNLGAYFWSSPIEASEITNFDDIKLIWQHGFDTLDVESHLCPLLTTECVFNPLDLRATTCELLFEAFQVPWWRFARTPVLHALGNGITNGIIVEIGAGSVQCVPISERTPLSHAICRERLGGTDVTCHLMKLLSHSVANCTRVLQSTGDREICRCIKENMCSIRPRLHRNSLLGATNRDTEAQRYSLPDGTSVTIMEEMYCAPEVLFDPSLISFEHGQKLQGCHQVVLESLEKLGPEATNMVEAIYLTGGCANMKGIRARLEEEIRTVYPEAKVRTLKDKDLGAWRGGSIFAEWSPPSSKWWISKQYYEENGAHQIMHNEPQFFNM